MGHHETPPQLDSAPVGLRRDLGLLDAVGIGLGAMIGAGLFVVTGMAAAAAGPALILGLMAAAAVATFNALSAAELASAYPEAGGTYEYGRRLLRPWIGFAAGWMFLVSKLAAGGTVALGLGAASNYLVPDLPDRVPAVAVVLLLTFANAFGIKKAGQLNTLIVAVTVTGLFVFILAGLPRFQFENWRPFLPRGWGGVAEAAAMLFFAFTGYARLATLGAEVRDPTRTLPRAILLTLAMATLLYLAVVVVAVGSVGAETLAASSAPLQHAASQLPVVASPALAIAAITALLGVLLSQIIGISRMFYAMARGTDLPEFMGWVSSSTHVPLAAVIVTGGTITGVAVIGGLKEVAATAAFTILLYYAITNWAALRLTGTRKRYPRWIALLGLASCLGLAAALPQSTILLGFALLAGGLIWRFCWRWMGGRTQPT